MSVQAAHWSEALAEHGVDDATVRHLVVQLSACEVSALAFCRLLERWARGEPDPCTPGRRQAALRHAADRAETAIAGLDRPLGRYLLELEPEQAEGRSWYGEPGAAELIDWAPVLSRAGVQRCSGTCRADLSRARRPRPCAPGALGRGGASTRRRIAGRSGPACSTSARTCSGGPRRICARSPPEEILSSRTLAFLPARD